MFRRYHDICRGNASPGRRQVGRRLAQVAPPRGVTLLELLIAMTIMVMIAGALAAIFRASQWGFEYNQGHGTATQHGRVVLERISRMAREATANETFPGFVVVAEQVGVWQFPDTLVLWHPDGQPLSPEGLPRLHELVLYCPHPNHPGTLVEITTQSTAELSADEGARASQIAAIKHSPDSHFSTLTNLLRTGAVDNAGVVDLRGAVRFEVLLRPSDAEWKDAAIPWEQLPWVQGIYGPETGLRQAWLRMELQLMAGEPPGKGAVDRRQAVPFFGTAALYSSMHKDRRP